MPNLTNPDVDTAADLNAAGWGLARQRGLLGIIFGSQHVAS
jgi:hypothetical protein